MGPADAPSWLEPVLSTNAPDDPPATSPDKTVASPLAWDVLEPRPGADITVISPLVVPTLVPDSIVMAPPWAL
jgi:hypothetical protein